MLFGIMITLAALPSASVALVIARSATLGIANGIAVTAGIILGDLVFILLAVFGLTLVADVMGSLFLVVKYVGAAYLLWLGYSLITSENTATIKIDKKIKKQNLATSLLAGFVLTLGDIKAIVFYASLLPAFINLSTPSTSDILIIISVMIVSLASVKTLYAFSATKIIAITDNNAYQKTVGGLLLGAGGYLIVKA